MEFNEQFYNKNKYSDINISELFSNVEFIEKMWYTIDQEMIKKYEKNKSKIIITTGFGISGEPHLGTISQMIKMIYLQKKGYDVQIVLGDLDAYNSRNLSYDKIEKLVLNYKKLIIGLGFDLKKGILRTQSEYKDLFILQSKLSKYIKDSDFEEEKEELFDLYVENKVISKIDFSIKYSILLMISDFYDLFINKNYDIVIISLGIEENKYVNIAKKVNERLGNIYNLGAIYTKIIKGINKFSKMSKSLSGSSINLKMNKEEIKKIIYNLTDKELIEIKEFFWMELKEYDDINSLKNGLLYFIYKCLDFWEY